jgi:ATP-dependent RNA helicase DeaD
MPSPKSPPASVPVPVSDYAEVLGPKLCAALEKKGYATLTPVQASVLEPENQERDLRISSQTGSGKTLAIGFALREMVSEVKPLARGQSPAPRALVIVPTRELAKQVRDELGWLYAPQGLKIAAVTGGSSYRDEHRSLSEGPGVVVGTPGRLLDHLNRGGIDTTQVGAVVLDEADRMLDLGFREELESILGKLPKEHRTHLVSATFAREVKALADRVQKHPVHVQGTPLGSANTDIDHVIYMVLPRERNDALINVLLHHSEEQTLVFARTRADVANITEELSNAGFAAGALSGEMQQLARNRALSAFKRGEIRALVATDVAARGIDVQDIARVVQVDPPTNTDTYTHRSGRTGRAGRKGTSALLVAPATFRRTAALLERAGIRFRIEQIPTRETIQAAQDERFLNELTAGDEPVPEHVQTLVASLVERGAAESALGRLLARVQRSAGEPREITKVSLDAPRGKGPPGRSDDRRAPFGRNARRDDDGPPRAQRDSGPRGARFAERDSGERDERRGPPRGEQGFVPFRVSFGENQGADARRLVAMLCRRGNVRGSDLGAIRVNRDFSTVEVSARVASDFAEATREPDPRDPRVTVTPVSARAARSVPRHERPESFEPRPRAHEPRPRVSDDAPPRALKSRPRSEDAPPHAFEPRAHANDDAPPRAFEPRPRKDGPSRAFESRPRKDGPSRAFESRPRKDGPPRAFESRPRKDGPPRTFEPRPRKDGPPRTFEPRPRAHEARPAAPEAPARAHKPRPRIHEAPPRTAHKTRSRVHEAKPNATARELARGGDEPPKRHKKS